MIRRLHVLFFSVVFMIGTTGALASETASELDCKPRFLYADGVESGIVVQLFHQVIPCLEAGESQEIVLNSNGGDAWAGYGAYNALRHYAADGGNLTTTIYGGGHSAAAIIFLAGDVRRIGCNSGMLLHPVTTNATVSTDNPAELASLSQRNEAANDMYVEILSIRTTMSPDEARAALAEHRMHTAQEALRLGLATEIVGCE